MRVAAPSLAQRATARHLGNGLRIANFEQANAMKSILRLVASTAMLALASLPAGGQAQSYDLIIRNGRVLDGTGNPWFPADIGVRGGRIVTVGSLAGATATRVIDASGRYVAPGFIDIHSHADDGSSPRGGFRDTDARIRTAPNLVSQGITTVVVNHDGRSPLPIS